MRRFIIALYTLIVYLFIFNSISTNFSGINVYTDISSSEPKKQYRIFIELNENKLYLYENAQIIKDYRIASGKWDSPSPVGTWKIIEKDSWGDAFGGSWMGLNVPWGKYGIHGTSNPYSIGSDASHGCIRMFNKDAQQLYDLVPRGTEVVISNGKYGPLGKNPRTMIPGDVGSDILEVQRKLKELGFYKGPLDGKFGDTTKESLFKFQESKGIWLHNEIYRIDLKKMGYEFEE